MRQLIISFCLSSLLLSAVPARAQTAAKNELTPDYLNTSLPVSRRVEDLVSRMTLEEKIAQLGSHWVYEVLDSAAFSVSKAQNLLANGIGHITRIGGASSLRPAESAAPRASARC